jgi:hypothetical protein
VRGEDLRPSWVGEWESGGRRLGERPAGEGTVTGDAPSLASPPPAGVISGDITY